MNTRDQAIMVCSALASARALDMFSVTPYEVVGIPSVYNLVWRAYDLAYSMGEAPLPSLAERWAEAECLLRCGDV